MGLGKRLVNLVRANLNALLDTVSQDTPIDELSDEALVAELERRKRAREEERRREQDAPPPRTPVPPRVSSPRAPSSSTGTPPRAQTQQARAGTPPPRRPSPTPRRPPTERERIAALYAILETPTGSDLDTVKKSFRKLMLKHHPDRNASTPALQRAAEERSKRITEAFTALELHLLGKRA